MVIAVVGSGGKTTLIKKLAASCRKKGKTVLITTTTHMFREPDTLLTDDPEVIRQALQERRCVMAGLPAGEKIRGFSPETFQKVCRAADVVLVEADGSKQLPLKYPGESEPVIPENTDQIIVVCGLNALDRRAKEVCHRLELVKACLAIEDDTRISARHIQKLVTAGYLIPLGAAFPKTSICLRPRHNGSLFQRILAAYLRAAAFVQRRRFLRKTVFSKTTL